MNAHVNCEQLAGCGNNWVHRVLLGKHCRIFKYSRTFQGLNFSFQQLFDRGQIKLLTCKLNFLFNVIVSVVDEHMYRFKFVPKLAKYGVPDA